MKKSHILSISILFLFFTACKDLKTEHTAKDSLSTIEIIDPEAEQLFSKDSSVQVLASGFEWVEGPLWLKDQQKLIFSDVPTNKIYSWTEKDSLQLYLTPSGYTDTVPHNGEMGSNGLSLSNKGTLVLCQHGDRRIAEMQAPLNAPVAAFKTLAGTYQEKRFNSPNDIFCDTKGNYYFTDPPYGLEKNDQDPKKEIKYQGVYRIKSDSIVELLIDTLTRPNGILLSKDDLKLYVANSDPEHAIWAVYDLDAQGKITSGKVLFDATSFAGKEKGLPDGMCMNSKGYIFATGPGGVWVFNPSGKHIATIHIKKATSNVELDDTESYLYITADMYLLRLKLNK